MIQNSYVTLFLISIVFGTFTYAAEPASQLPEGEIDPESAVQKPPAAEKRRAEKSGITSFTERFKKSREKKEPESYILITDDFVNTSGASDLEVGKEPTPEQLKNLKEDMVWIRKEEIGGYEIHYPVVYIAEEYNQSDEPNKTDTPQKSKK